VIGASQAFFNPAAYTLLSEIFPKKIIGSINGIFSSGVYLGGGLASLSIILDSSIGWRNTLFVIGGLGVVISGMCYFLVSEPRAVIRKEKEKEKEDEMKENSNISSSSLTTTAPATVDVQSVTDVISSAITSLKEVLESNEARLLFFASVLRFCAGFSIAIWKAPFVFAKFPENASSFAGKHGIF
jgi:MFS transporter, Spinster family, sphingosine-1-phosphate transporter